MTLIQIAILALIQGAAELLPVSSSAHVIVAQKLMGLDPASPQMTFMLVMLHTGTMGAVLLYFWKRWVALFSKDKLKPTVIQVILATGFTGVIGLGLKFFIEHVLLSSHGEAGEFRELFRSLPVIGGALFSVGILIFAAGRRELANHAAGERKEITRADSIWIGVVQGICLPFRGFSRSGATISTGLFRQLRRGLCEDFSFLLAVVLTPPVIASEFLRLLKAQGAASVAEAGGWSTLVGPGVLGMVLAFVSGWFALKLLSRWLEAGKWHFFGVYCFVASLGIFALAGAGY